MKVVQTLPDVRKPVTQQEVVKFLEESKLNLQLATIDSDGYPVIQPVWYLYDKDADIIYVGTSKKSRKTENIKRKPDRIYFSIDDESSPPKGVKGRGTAKLSQDITKNTSIVEKLNMKYLGTTEHPLAKMLIEAAKKGDEIVIEIKPKFFSAWDFGKQMQ
jgi:general stress protein 26